MFKQNRIYSFLLMLTMLFVVSTQKVWADEDQPYFYIPSVEFSDHGQNGFSYSSPTNPYFTLYLWYLNDDQKDSHWTSDPTLTIDDKYSVTIPGLKDHYDDMKKGLGYKPFDILTCEKDGKIVYWVRYKRQFKAYDEDNTNFTKTFPLCDIAHNKNAINDDYYAELEIIFADNIEGTPHSVKCHGMARTDAGTKDYECIDPTTFNSKTVYTGDTYTPFGVFQNGQSSLIWTDVKTLTFTSPTFNEKRNLGFYQVSLDGELSKRKQSDSIKVTKKYNSPVGYGEQVTPLSYMFYDTYNYKDKEQRRNNYSNTLKWEHKSFDGKSVYYEDGDENSYFIYKDNNLDLSSDDYAVRIKGPKIDYMGYVNAGDIKISSLDQKKITKATVVTSTGKYEWSGFASDCSIAVGNELVLSVEVTFDMTANGWGIIFREDTTKTAQKMARIKNLDLYEANPWNNIMTLSWEFNDIDTRTMIADGVYNYNGVFRIYRDGEEVPSSPLPINDTNPIRYWQDQLKKEDIGKNHKYTVAFQPQGWTGTDTDSLTISGTYRLDYTLDIQNLDAKVNEDRNGYELSWNINTDLKSTDTDYWFKIYKIIANKDNPTASDFSDTDCIDSIKVSDLTQHNYKYTDKIVNSTNTYAYRVSIKAQGTTFYSPITIPSEHPDGTRLNNMTASHGTSPNEIKVSWYATVNANDYLDYSLYRHKITTNDSRITTLDGLTDSVSWKQIELDKSYENTNVDRFTYTDKVNDGSYYAYAVVARASGTDTIKCRAICDGFARSTATVSGKITYPGNSSNSEYAVEGVKVSVQAEGDEGLSIFNSLYFDGGGKVMWPVGKAKMDNYFRNNHAFSTQMYVKPANNQSNMCLLDIDSTLCLSLGALDASTGRYPIVATVGGQTYTSSLQISPAHFSSISFTYDGNGKGMLYVSTPDINEGSITKEQLLDGVAISWLPQTSSQVILGSKADETDRFNGYIDDVRFFKRELTQADIEKNYNHILGGIESGLIAYWPFDESIYTLRQAFDYSYDENGFINDNYAYILGALRTNNAIPTPDQLALFAYTDTIGKYRVQGIPFTSDDTSYKVIPSKGVHQFAYQGDKNKPAASITVSSQNTEFPNTDFTDVSSFNVRGYVFYENTTYPVDSCYFMVDDVVIKDANNRLITSNADGEFCIPVSTGEHKIRIMKKDHTFLHDGYYPAEGYFNFNDSISNLTFTDLTKAVVVGRVVGGSIEKGKQLGFGESTATIGAATLTLITSNSIADARRMNVYLNSETGTFENCDDTLHYKNASEYVVSEAYTAGYVEGVNTSDVIKKIIIHTDPRSGEFAVELPPVPYYVSTVVDNNEEATSGLLSNFILDASNVSVCDTSYFEGKTLVYNTAFVQAYTSTPLISVRQTDNDAGAFGAAQTVVTNADDTTQKLDVYTVQDGKVRYNYGYPIFECAGRYTLDISSYEKYTNYDGATPVDYQVPSSGVVHISNLISSSADTAKVAPLDSLGHYIYTFQAMNPNIESPYTRPLSIAIDINGVYDQWYWDEANELPLQGIPFGAVLTGNSFVTKAPDQITNILRDPFGGTSSLTWVKGTTHSTTWQSTIYFEGAGEGDVLHERGIENGSAVGVPIVGGGYTVFGNEAMGGRDNDTELFLNLNADFSKTWTSTTTNSISTSSDPSYDGPDGDVYIGVSNSMIYGDGKNVQLINDQNGGWKIGVDDVIVTGDSIESTFIYSQFFIETQLIPGFERDRNALFELVSESEMQSMINTSKNNSDKPVYITARRPGSPDFGINNDSTFISKSNNCLYGNSYAVFFPMDEKVGNDMVSDYNMQIEAWKSHIAENEYNKLTARNNSTRYFKRNIAFDNASASFESSESHNIGKDGSWDFGVKKLHKIVFNGEIAKVAATKSSLSFGITFKLAHKGSISHQEDSTICYTAVLSDNEDFNSHNVNVYSAPDDFSPIFVQLGGQTSRYYEGEQLARYYEPEKKHRISDATVQIDVPHIQCDKPVVTGVPAKGAAEFKLKLTNATSALGIDWGLDYTLAVVNDKWAQVASVSSNSHDMVDGKCGITLTKNNTESDSALVSLRVGRASDDVFNIDSLHLKFYPTGETAIYDDIYLSAHFLPDAEPVELKSSRTLVNTATDSTLVLSASGFNINNRLLSAVRLEQSRGNDSEWTTIRNYVKNPAGSTESLLTADGVDTLVNMRSNIFYPDDVYYFRAVTVCPIDGEDVEGYSNIIKVVKDVTLPDVMETPSPSDGVLNVGDKIGLTFNEDILSKSLNKIDNFIVQSVLNTDSVAHDVALLLPGSEEAVATSQSTLTLGGTSFTLCGWIKSGDTAGTIYRHGEGEKAFRLDIDEDGYITAYVTDSLGQALPYKTTSPIKKNIWTYLGVVYNVKSGMLNIYSAYGSEEKQLMNEVYVGKSANSSGNIYLGKGVTGAMHELTLFSQNLTWDTIKAQMYLGKNHSTPSLIGYWRLDEGYGTKSEDLARSRHMILSSANNWYFENENISLALDGTHYAGALMGTLSATRGVSYLLEMWALADTDPTNADEEMQLFSLDEGKRLDAVIKNGKLMLVADSTYYDTNTALDDHQWHHIALNVLNGNAGQANLLVDGTSVWSISNDKLPELAGGYLWFGRNMKGMLDEIRLWHSTNTREAINDRMYYRLDGKNEYGLVGYWPMEESHFNEYNQREFNFSLQNMGYKATDKTALTPETEGVELGAGTSAPGLKVAPHKSNLQFDFVADERTVNISLLQSAKSIEGCTVFTTLRDYYDTNSNVGNPISWSFVVKQNPFNWNTGEIDVKAEAGSDATFTATLFNNSEGDQGWAFSELPEWLEANPSSGTVFAHGSTDVTFTVKGINPIGKYFTTVNARTQNSDEGSQLDTPLDICLTVIGQKPDWQVNTSYDESMPVIGQIMINGIISSDPDDMVGAFTGNNGDMSGECIGVGSPVYNAKKDAYYVSMLVHGTKAMKNDTIRFRLYDASTGHVYPLTNVSQTVTFIPDGEAGSTDNPVIWSNIDKLLQTISLASGCNWISLYLDPINPEISELFRPVASKIDSIEVAPDVMLRYRDGSWDGTANIKPGQMIKVSMNNDAVLQVIGNAVKPADYPITIAPNNSSTWVGVPSSSYMTVDEAFANISPVDGDKVKNQHLFTTYEDGKWLTEGGALTTIEPGKGYIYTSHATEEKQLVFPDENPQNTGLMKHDDYLSIPAHYKYADNMTITCTVRNQDGALVLPEEVDVYSSTGELRGASREIFRDSLLIIVVSGQHDGETLMVKANVGTASLGNQPVTVINFKKNQHLGSLHRPLVISALATDISETEFDADSRLAIYTVTGMPVFKGQASAFDSDKLSLGEVYIICETKSDGSTTTRKAVKR